MVVCVSADDVKEESIVVEAIGAFFSVLSLLVVCSLIAELVNLSVEWRQRFIEFVHESAERCHIFMVVC
jgi:hypothetical protein